MKNLKLKSILLILITIVVLLVVIKDDLPRILYNLGQARLIFILLGIFFLFLYWFFKALALHGIVYNYEKIKLREILKIIIITQFFHGITPFASGGQPMQVYMLKKKGIKIAHSTNIIIQNFILYQMALITHGIIAVFLNYKFNFLTNNDVLRNLTILGFSINALVGIVLIIVSFSNKFNRFILKFIIKVCYKFRLVKDKNKTIDKWRRKLNEYHESATLLRENKGIIIKGYLYNICGLLAYYLTPLFVIYSLSININPVIVYVCSAYVTIVGSFVPIPGGSGGIEYSFLQFFGNYISGPVLPAILILWRSITYYFSMIVGGILFTTFKGSDGKE